MYVNQGYGNKAKVSYFVTEAEFTTIDTALVGVVHTPGDECWVYNSTAKNMVAAYIWTGDMWCMYVTF